MNKNMTYCLQRLNLMSELLTTAEPTKCGLAENISVVNRNLLFHWYFHILFLHVAGSAEAHGCILFVKTAIEILLYYIIAWVHK